ncbi:MAG: c-type cytochrome [Burkholderiales bacterium]
MKLPSRKAQAAIACVLAVAASVFWLLTRPDPLPASAIPAHTPDLGNGEVVFHAGSCFACHKAAEGAPDRSLPSGGSPFKTPIGVFYPQNLTPDAETGLGRWSEADFVNAMTRGLSPDGRHYFPAFPYMAYRAMRTADLLDLRAYLMSLPAVKSVAPRHALPLLPVARRGVGLWKQLAFARAPYAPAGEGSDSWKRGAYLVNAPGHCGECHTPKSLLMVEDLGRYMAGGPHPGGDGKVPSLRGLVERKKYKDAADLVLALQNGEELGYEDLSSGGMGQIQSNLAQLPEPDVRAIADYLVSLK